MSFTPYPVWLIKIYLLLSSNKITNLFYFVGKILPVRVEVPNYDTRPTTSDVLVAAIF